MSLDTRAAADCGHAKCRGEPVEIHGRLHETLTCHLCRIAQLEAELEQAEATLEAVGEWAKKQRATLSKASDLDEAYNPAVRVMQIAVTEIEAVLNSTR